MAERPDILRKVQAMIDKAEGTTFPDERDAFLAKADAMMAAYAIEQFELEFAKDAKDRARQPEMRLMEYGHTGDDEADRELYYVFHELAGLTGCLIGYLGWSSSKVVGYPEDLGYLDMLMTNLRLHLAMTIRPQVSPQLTLEENLAALKEAGLKWQAIWEALVKVYPDDPHFAKGLIPEDAPGWKFSSCINVNGKSFEKTVPRNVGVWFTGVYTKFCAETGRDRIYSNPETYRRNFREAYLLEVRNRIRAMRRAREEAGTGKELVLASMRDRLQEALWEFFPEQRPHPPECECDDCHALKCADPRCTRPRCRARRAPVRASRGGYRSPPEQKIDHAARAAGRRAGSQVDLTGGRRNVGNNPKGEIG